MMDYKEKLQSLTAVRNSYNDILTEKQDRLKKIDNEYNVIQKSQTLIQEVAKIVQSQLSSKIDTIVNLGLSSCFPEYSFQMVYESSRNKTEVLFKVFNNGVEIDPMNQCGGGLVDVLCFCLRIAVYSISNVNNVLIYDEPFKYVSHSLRPSIANLLSVLCEKLDLQIVAVTHIDELSESADKRIEIRKVNRVSEVV